MKPTINRNLNQNQNQKQVEKSLRMFEANVRNGMKEEEKSRKNKLKLIEAANKPMIEFYKSLHGNNKDALRKYYEAAIKESNDKQKTMYARRGNGSSDEVFPRTYPGADDQVNVPAGDPRFGGNLRKPAKTESWPKFNSRTGEEPMPYVFLPTPHTTLAGQFGPFSGAPSLKGNLLGGKLLVGKGESGSVLLKQYSGVIYHAAENGWTGVTFRYDPIGSVMMYALLGYGFCECSMQLQMHQLGSLNSGVLDSQTYYYTKNLGTIDVPITSTSSPGRLDGGFNRKVSNSYLIVAELSIKLELYQFAFPEVLKKTYLASCQQMVLIRGLTVFSF